MFSLCKYFKSFITTKKQIRKEKLVKDLGLDSWSSVATEASVNSLKEDVDEILKILGYKRRDLLSNMFCEIYAGEKRTRFSKVKRNRK